MTVAAPTNSILSSVIDAVTLQQTAEGAAENVSSYSEVWKKLKANGRVSAEGGGTDVQRQWHVGLPTAQLLASGTARTWSQSNQYIATRHPWSNVDSHDSILMNDVRANNSKEGLVKLNKRLISSICQSLTNKLAGDVLQSNAGQNTVATVAAASANPVPMAGALTLFGYGATAQNYNPTTRATTGNVAAGDIEVLPDMSYFGHSTNPLDTLTGITNQFPECFSPVIVNENSTVWAGASNNWAGNAVKVLNHMGLRTQRMKGAEGTADLFVTTNSRFQVALASFESTYHTILTSEGGSVPNRRVGGAANLEIPFGFGTLTWDSYLTIPVTFALNTRKMEYVHLPAGKLVIDPSLPMPREDSNVSGMVFVDTQYDATQVAHLAGAQVTGALIMDPRWHAMSYAFA